MGKRCLPGENNLEGDLESTILGQFRWGVGGRMESISGLWRPGPLGGMTFSWASPRLHGKVCPIVKSKRVLQEAAGGGGGGAAAARAQGGRRRGSLGTGG